MRAANDRFTYNMPRPDPYFIVELRGKFVELFAQMLHMRLLSDPEDELAQAALALLKEQTTSVHDDPKDHYVYETELRVPDYIKARESKAIFYKRLNL